MTRRWQGPSTVSSMRLWMRIIASMLCVLLTADFLVTSDAAAQLAATFGLFAQLADDLGTAPRLPAVALLGCPLVAGLPVVTDVDRGWRALEHVHALRRLGEVGDDLYGACTGADDADAERR